MTTAPAIREVFQGTADRHHIYRMFDRHPPLLFSKPSIVPNALSRVSRVTSGRRASPTSD